MGAKRESRLRRLGDSEKAAVAIEYCLIGGALAVAIMAGMPALRDGVAASFGTIAAAFQIGT